MRLLSVPVPLFAGVVVPQVSPELLDRGPGWLATALLGAWVTLWFLDRVGKLPGASRADSNGPGSAFKDEDRKKLDSLYHLFLFRGDEDGIERFPKFMQESRVADARVVELLTETNAKLERLITTMEGRQ